jgi:hypothetical protein
VTNVFADEAEIIVPTSLYSTAPLIESLTKICVNKLLLVIELKVIPLNMTRLSLTLIGEHPYKLDVYIPVQADKVV